MDVRWITSIAPGGCEWHRAWERGPWPRHRLHGPHLALLFEKKSPKRRLEGDHPPRRAAHALQRGPDRLAPETAAVVAAGIVAIIAAQLRLPDALL